MSNIVRVEPRDTNLYCGTKRETKCLAPLHVSRLAPACNGPPWLLKRAYLRACQDYIKMLDGGSESLIEKYA